MKKLAMLFFIFTGSVNAATTEYIVNGGFETGDFTGWSVTNTGTGAWDINDGTFDPFGPATALAPISGLYDVITSQDNPGFHSLSQTILLPTEFDIATLSWDDRIQSAALFSDPNQEWRVLIQDLSNVTIAEVFSTNPGDAAIQIGPNSRLFDLTSVLSSYAGQGVSISFEEEDNEGIFNASLDNVSFTTSVSAVPEPSTYALMLAGLGLVGFMASRRKSI